MKVLLLFSLAFFYGLGIAGKPTTLQYYSVGYQTFYACGYYIVLNVQYSTTPYDYSVFCTNPEAMATLVGCYADENKNNAADTAFWREKCESIYLSPITYENITDAYQYLLESGVPLAEVGNYTAGNLDVPVIIPEEDAIAAMDSYGMFLGNYNHSVYYGAGSLAYWGLVCLLSGIANWSLVIFPNLRLAVDGKVSRLWRKYVTLPALVRKKKTTSQPFLKVLSFIVPSRFESLVIFGFFWILFILNAVEIYAVKNEALFDLQVAAFNRYVADRTGIVCIIVLPLLILFGGRNNFLMWITRWKFSTFITYHRWIARFVVLLAFVHGLCFWRTFALAGDTAEESAETYVIWGIVAFCCGIIICFQGLLYLRRLWYEFFLVFHIILAAFFVIGTWYHIYELGYSQFMYATFAVWAFDRIIRLVRVLYFGFPEAEVSLFSDDTIKVDVPKPAHWKGIPGGHAYLYFMHSYHFWQSHPFTYNELESHVTFFCKLKDGVTKALYEHLSNLPGKTTQMRVSVEGPYGESHPVKHHSDVVFVAGGNGLPGLYSEFEHLNKAADGKQKLKLKWIIREIKSFAWMWKEFQRYRNTNAEITIFVTCPQLAGDTEEFESFLNGDASFSDENKEEKESSSDVLAQLRREFPYISFVEGRPEIKQIIEQDIKEAGNSVAFIVCGAPLMVDETRYQVVKHIDQTSKRVDFYEALEVWA
ncbi:hypothetical protein METBIDRAFT_40351 [Metschnikowia bicuspidata var. bicuspidata NRRL YB-4993]|uniref:FAD-binding FR-type domain-containing protein n=1 Tax=Metschnikowia bicuspidata var. bicuspidata NRRL YB-4993 TaxID=869754 RepID=A0A1A0HD44_9ASCO|nr:hypothetical protein METBIDRAFT_40351 [Metschnikowia bicuspidata var. bicuspidata NRRL YB-4993]OBA21817.1 hypothetical protein METBIDRAFT_40351 [Metschnikowia bicuspidata var. bicuspidata NRRL YB-4993]